MKITLDYNCLINLQNKTSEWRFVKEIVDLHKQEKIEAYVCAISASEYQSGDEPDYREFQEFLQGVGCSDLPEVLPISYFGVAFWGHALYSGEEQEDLEKKIHKILFPSIEFEYQDYCRVNEIDPNKKPLDRKWLNKKCDVQVTWSHINSSNDVLVTEDKNFSKQEKLNKLLQLGVKRIQSPKEFIDEFN